MEALTPLAPELLVATCAAQGQALFRNQVWRSTFGDEDDPWTRLAEADRELAMQYLSEAAGGALVTNELFLVSVPDRDEPLPVLLNFLPVHDQGAGPSQTVTITGEALAEPGSWTMNQTQRHRMETLGRMTMGIAHDFNNLLSGILGHIELMKTAPPDEPLEEHLHTIEQAALDGATLVRKIQQYIRQEKQTDFEVLYLPTLIRDCMALTRPYWYNEPRRQGIAIDFELDLREVPRIMGAAAELRDVFVNMILNAVQAMPQGGTLTFATHYEAKRGAVVTIRDTGTGMADRTRARIFEPLFTTKGARGGTGMGLAVSYGIIQEHEGTIAVASALGEGTCFTLTFPTVETPLPEVPEDADEAASQNARILIVDDEAMVRKVLYKLLTLKGHHVTEAASGAEALALVEADPTAFDLIFTDQGMPLMNGRQLARALRTPLPDIPIILLTGDTEVGEPDEEVDVIIAKPFKIDMLQATIQELL